MEEEGAITEGTTPTSEAATITAAEEVGEAAVVVRSDNPNGLEREREIVIIIKKQSYY